MTQQPAVPSDSCQHPGLSACFAGCRKGRVEVLDGFWPEGKTPHIRRAEQRRPLSWPDLDNLGEAHLAQGAVVGTVLQLHAGAPALRSPVFRTLLATGFTCSPRQSVGARPSRRKARQQGMGCGKQVAPSVREPGNNSRVWPTHRGRPHRRTARRPIFSLLLFLTRSCSRYSRHHRQDTGG